MAKAEKIVCRSENLMQNTPGINRIVNLFLKSPWHTVCVYAFSLKQDVIFLCSKNILNNKRVWGFIWNRMQLFVGEMKTLFFMFWSVSMRGSGTERRKYCEWGSKMRVFLYYSSTWGRSISNVPHWGWNHQFFISSPWKSADSNLNVEDILRGRKFIQI